MKLLILVLLLIFFEDLFANTDTIYLKSDSTIVITYIQESENSIYKLKVFDKKKDIVLYEMPGWSAQSYLIKKSENHYHIVVKAYLPVFEKSEWRKYEIVRYVLKVNANKHKFYKTYYYSDIPQLNSEQIEQILSESEKIHTNSFIESQRDTLEKVYGEYLDGVCYMRNIGFLALGILNDDSLCLNRFNKVWDKCIGGASCESYRSIQKFLSYAEFELWFRNNKKDPILYLKKTQD